MLERFMLAAKTHATPVPFGRRPSRRETARGIAGYAGAREPATAARPARAPRARRGIALGLIIAFSPLLVPSAHTATEPDAATPPRLLSRTGLYVEGATTEIRPGVLAFSPQYPLWTDGATKRRWIALPPGAFIDASDPNAWEFPIGTRLWKEFAMGRPIETRLVERLADGSWRFATYVWNDDGSDAVLAPADGIAHLAVDRSPNGHYAIPSEYDCRACHEGGPTPVLGFSALQLSPDRDPLAPHAQPAMADDVDLHALVERGLVRNLPRFLLDRPPRIAAASSEERAVLGYLHGNCGHCHGDPATTGAAVPVDVLLMQDAGDPQSASKVLQSLIDAPSRFRGAGSGEDAKVVAPGRADRSVLVARMRSRDPRTQMPPLGTAIPDKDSLALIERWITQLPSTTQEKRP